MNTSDRLSDNGFAIVSDVLPAEMIEQLKGLFEDLPAEREVRQRRGTTYAVRNLFTAVPAIRTLAWSPAVRLLVEPVLGPSAFPVRAVLFDKTPAANWKVPWHQDLAIAVAERHETPGYGPWSTKAGVVHVEPPPAVLESMLTVRLSLDSCGPQNGPLRVLPGTHRLGRLSDERIQQLRQEGEEVTCTVTAGGALLMRPLLLHSSSAALEPRSRRIIHLEFASSPLPPPLQWHEATAVV